MSFYSAFCFGFTYYLTCFFSSNYDLNFIKKNMGLKKIHLMNKDMMINMNLYMHKRITPTIFFINLNQRIKFTQSKKKKKDLHIKNKLRG